MYLFLFPFLFINIFNGTNNIINTIIEQNIHIELTSVIHNIPKHNNGLITPIIPL